MARVLHQNANRPKILSNGFKNDKPTLIVFAQQSFADATMYNVNLLKIKRGYYLFLPPRVSG